MKIKSEHLEVIQKAFRDNASRIVQHFHYLKSDECTRKPKDIQMRLRWDILHFVLGANWICDTLYPYLNDEHIDTALRAVMDKIKSEKDLAKLLA